MAVQRILELDFATELGRTQRLRVYDARDDLTPAEVTTIMNDIVAKNIFSGAGGELTGKIGARVISTETSDIELV